MKEIFDSLLSYLGERLSSRYLGYLSIILGVYNYDNIIIIFSDTISSLEKINLIHSHIVHPNWLGYVIILLLPLGIIPLIDYLSLLLDIITSHSYRVRLSKKQQKLSLSEQAKALERKEQSYRELIKDQERLNDLIKIIPMDVFAKIETLKAEAVYTDATLTESLTRIIDYLNNNHFYTFTLANYIGNLKSNVRTILDFQRDSSFSGENLKGVYSERVLPAFRNIIDTISSMRHEINKGL